jgi:hypothetical protein
MVIFTKDEANDMLDAMFAADYISGHTTDATMARNRSVDSAIEQLMDFGRTDRNTLIEKLYSITEGKS